MARKYAELRARMSPEAQQRAAKKAADMIPSVVIDTAPHLLASAIVKISEACVALQASGLNERAICALVKDHAGIPISTTQAVLRSLRELRARYTTR